MKKHLVFVYGTLRRGGARAMSIRFPNSKFIADAKVSGSLYDLGAYPGLLLNESNSLVIGEVYEVDDETLNKLDDFEASSHIGGSRLKSPSIPTKGCVGLMNLILNCFPIVH